MLKTFNLSPVLHSFDWSSMRNSFNLSSMPIMLPCGSGAQLGQSVFRAQLVLQSRHRWSPKSSQARVTRGVRVAWLTDTKRYVSSIDSGLCG